MPEKTELEKQEEEIGAVLGKPTGLNTSDKSMLEISPTNRLIIDARQSELQIALNLIHDALVAHDNAVPTTERIYDEQSGKWYTKQVEIDNWAWLDRLDHIIRTNQLTIKGYSRAQHLRQGANLSPIAVEEEAGPGFLARLFGGR